MYVFTASNPVQFTRLGIESLHLFHQVLRADWDLIELVTPRLTSLNPGQPTPQRILTWATVSTCFGRNPVVAAAWFEDRSHHLFQAGCSVLAARMG